MTFRGFWLGLVASIGVDLADNGFVSLGVAVMVASVVGVVWLARVERRAK